MEEILTTEDMLRQLRCGKATLWRLINSGQIRPFRVGRRRLVLRRDFEQFLTQIAQEQTELLRGGRR